MPDAYLSQANPVSNTVYTILGTTKDVQVESIGLQLTWATTQPTNLRIIGTIDGQTIIHTIAAPVTATPYFPIITPIWNPATQALSTTLSSANEMALKILSGKSVKIDMAVTWDTTQPTPIIGCVKYAVLT